MSVDEQRAWFEAWCISEGINAERSTTTGVYSFPSARVAWRAWKAAEAAAIERCAKVCDEWQRQYVLEQCCDVAQDDALKSVAAAIRAPLPKEEV